MTIDESLSPLHVPARDIPVPYSVSPEARAVIAMPPVGGQPYPDLDDVDGWRRNIAERDAMVITMLQDRGPEVPAEVEEIEVRGVRVFVITPAGMAGDGTSLDDRRVCLEIHGGALTMGG